MSYTHSLMQRIAVGGVSIENTIDNTFNARSGFDESIATGSTDARIEFTLDVSQVKSFYLVSDQSVTFETNNGTTPANTISLVANVPYVWHKDSYDAFKLTTDVTAVFITNTSGSTAAVKCEALYDPTV